MATDPTSVTVEAAVLVTHAGAVDSVADTVRRGQDAVGQVRLGPDAYGQLCQALPAMLGPLHDLADQVLADARTALEESALSLRTAARTYETADANAGIRLSTPSPVAPKLQLPLRPH